MDQVCHWIHFSRLHTRNYSPLWSMKQDLVEWRVDRLRSLVRLMISHWWHLCSTGHHSFSSPCRGEEVRMNIFTLFSSAVRPWTERSDHLKRHSMPMLCFIDDDDDQHLNNIYDFNHTASCSHGHQGTSMNCFTFSSAVSFSRQTIID